MYLAPLFLLLVPFTTGAKILGVIPAPSYSHQIFFRPLWLELAKHGHDLTLLTTDPIPNPPVNLKQIDWSFTYDLRRNKHNTTKVNKENKYNWWKIIRAYQAMLLDIIDQELLAEEVQIMLRNSSEYFDLVMVEYQHPSMLGFAHRFQCPYIGLSSTDISSFYHELLGNPAHPVLYPENLLPFDRNLKFSERVLSSLYTFFMWSTEIKRWFTTSGEQALAMKHFGDDVPLLKDIAKNVSMVFVNTHPVFSLRPLGPRIVSIGGGTHLKTLKPLPKELSEFLDSALEGVIYFSFGTNVLSSDVPEDFPQIFRETFAELPYKVLWKYDGTISNLPANVKVVKWVPQQDVLRHPKIKLFITQCGLQSMEETILSQVPVIGIPFVGDQNSNAKRILRREFGVVLDKKTVTKTVLKNAILEVITNPKYKTNVIHLAGLLQDEPMSGLDKAVWWTEYVLRHKGAKHLVDTSLDIPFYQFLLLDVIGFLLIVVLVPLYLLFKFVKFVIRRIRNRGNARHVKLE